ncbi:MAG TPA: hypothetical protein VNK52_04620 [Hyphomicrobiaceae bacterium]|nr:hypothetical protein [Hyphomicrobiaceae bacterium]
MIVVSLFRVVLGFVLACVVAAVVQIGFALTPAALFTDRADELAALAILLLRTATQLARFALSFALVVAIVGEWQSLRSSKFYGLSGVAISAAGFFAQSANEGPGQPTILNTYALTAYLSSGLAGGIAYWMLAGRFAGNRPASRQLPNRSVADQSTP